jgi:glycosyltransferase involved in cell wall biosynthesis
MMVDAYKPYVSGVTHQVELSKAALEKAGHEVYIFTFGRDEDADDEPRVIRSPGLALADTKVYLSLRYSRAAKKLLQTMDVVHVHHPFISGRLALRYCRSPKIPVVFTNHTRYDVYPHTYLPILPEEMGQSLLRAYMPDFCAAVELVTTPSAGMEQVLRDMDVTSRIEVVPNGVDVRTLRAAKPLPRAQFGWSQQDILLVYTGRIAPEKNISFLLQSFAGVARALPHVHLLLIGGGFKQFEDDLHESISDLGIANRVRLTGMIPYEAIPSYLAMCDIFVITSTAESFGMSTVEAMSKGLPVVGIRATGTSDIVEEGKTGLLSEENIAEYTAILTRMCMDDSLRKQMGAAAHTAAAKYDIDRVTKIMLGHYKRLKENTQPVKQRLDERLMTVLKEFFNEA